MKPLLNYPEVLIMQLIKFAEVRPLIFPRKFKEIMTDDTLNIYVHHSNSRSSSKFLKAFINQRLNKFKI